MWACWPGAKDMSYFSYNRQSYSDSLKNFIKHIKQWAFLWTMV